MTIQLEETNTASKWQTEIFKIRIDANAEHCSRIFVDFPSRFRENSEVRPAVGHEVYVLLPFYFRFQGRPKIDETYIWSMATSKVP